MARKITNRNTKAEIFDAYSDLNDELKELRKQIRELETKKSTPTPVAATPVAPPVEADEPMLLTVGQLLGSLDTLRGGFSESLGVLQGQLTSEAEQLQQLRERAAEYERQIHELHGFEIDPETLDRVINQYRDTSNSFDDDLEARMLAFEEELGELESSWKEELTEHQRAVKERDTELSKQRAREKQEYDYELAQTRTLDQERYDGSKRRAELELEELEATRREAFASREDALAERERAYAELKEKVEGFKERFASAVKKAEGEGKGIATRQARVKADLLAKESEGKRRVFELKIASLEQTASKQRAQIDSLTTQLSEAQRQAQELAVKAIEGASNASSFAAVREIAMEQAKHTPKGK